MYINLRCSECQEVSPTSYETLFRVWKHGYVQMPEDKRHKAYLTAEINCPCGNTEKFESPMFRYIFQTVFQEFLSLED